MRQIPRRSLGGLQLPDGAACSPSRSVRSHSACGARRLAADRHAGQHFQQNRRVAKCGQCRQLCLPAREPQARALAQRASPASELHHSRSVGGNTPMPRATVRKPAQSRLGASTPQALGKSTTAHRGQALRRGRALRSAPVLAAVTSTASTAAASARQVLGRERSSPDC